MTVTEVEIEGRNNDEFESEMDFCKGMSMTMSMGGFQSAFFSNGPADCITFLFTKWKLDRPGKFVGAMIATFLVAVMSEAIVHWQPNVRKHYLAGKTKHQRKTVMTLMYGFQQLLGWLLMLITMTFSIELFASVVLGLFVGKLLFPAQALTIRRARRTLDEMHDENEPLLHEESLEESSPSSDGSSESAIRRRRR